MKYDIVTIGDVLRDIFVFPSVDEMEKPINRRFIDRKVQGEKFLLFEFGDKIAISDIAYSIGGSAGNVAAGLAKMGLKSGVIGKVGRDHEGREVLSTLREAKVNTSLVDIEDEKKTSFSIILSYQGERSILVFHSFGPQDFEIPANLDTDWVYIGPLGEKYKSLYDKLTALAAEKNIKIALNPGSIQIKDGLNSFGGLLRVAKLIFLNKEEAAELAGIPGVANIRDIVNVLKKTGVEMIVITDGKDGAYFYTNDELVKVSAYPGNRLEATGAGDAFASGFLSAMIKNENIETCLKWGVTNSASVIEYIGAQQGLLSASVTKKRVNTYRWPNSSYR